MNWGAPLGFSSGPSPLERVISARFGEPDWYCRLRPCPTAEFPLRAVLITPCAIARFNNPDQAHLYLDHPGEIPELARRYVAWAVDGIDPNH